MAARRQGAQQPRGQRNAAAAIHADLQVSRNLHAAHVGYGAVVAWAAACIRALLPRAAAGITFR